MLRYQAPLPAKNTVNLALTPTAGKRRRAGSNSRMTVAASWSATATISLNRRASGPGLSMYGFHSQQAVTASSSTEVA